MTSKNKSCGTTLLELLIVMFLFNVLLASIYSLYKVSVDAWDIGLLRMTRISGTRSALQKIVWELDTAKVQTFTPPFSSTQTVSTQDILFTNDKNEVIKFYNKIFTHEQPLRKFYRMMRANITKGENPDEGNGGSPLGEGRMSFTLNPGGLMDITVAPDEQSRSYGTTIFPRN